LSRPVTPERPPAASLVWGGIWFALLAGYLEVVVLTGRLLADRFIHRSHDFYWMTPAGYLVVFGPIILLAWAAYRWSRLPFLLAVWVLATMAVGSILLVLLGGKLHLAALALLALGAGFQVGRTASARAGWFHRFARRTAPWMLALVGVLGAGSAVLRAWSERRALSGVPAAAPGASNIVLIILDTVRAASLGLYGYPKETSPELDRWARRGVVFDQAISTAPWTLPSHASMFTGRLPHEQSADWLTPLDGRWPTLAQTLSARGYRTGGFVANLIYATREHGLARGFAHYEDYPFSFGMLLRHTAPGRKLTDARFLRILIGTDEIIGRKSARRIGNDFLRWVDRDSTRPFFAFLNYYDAHDPYLPPQDFFRKFAGHYRLSQLSPLRRGGPFTRLDRLTAEELRMETAAYDGAIAYLDTELGRLFDELERRAILDRTVIIVTSDHGEEFGEHGTFFHGHTLYRDALHVPLMMLGPSIPRGMRVRQTVSLRNIPATVMDLLSLDDSFPGQALSRFWAGDTPPGETALSLTSRGVRIPDWFPSAGSDLASIVADSMHYIRGTGEQIFDWRHDQKEQTNLADTTRASGLLAHLRGLLESARAGGGTR
jgi:arylsulfatase A-like enzyme